MILLIEYQDHRCFSFILAKNRVNVNVLANNTICDDSDQGTIDNQEDCRSLLKSTYVTSFNNNVAKFKVESKKDQKNYPRGCYIYQNKTLYFNPHEKGKRSKSSNPVCKESKIYEKWLRLYRIT